MWFIEHETAFGGKRLWLRPGSRSLWGRTRPEKNDAQNKVFLDSKVVSRKHMEIAVLPVPAGDGVSRVAQHFAAPWLI